MMELVPRWVDLATSSSRWMRLSRHLKSGRGMFFRKLVGCCDGRGNFPAETQRQIHLGGLVVLRHVRIVVLPVPFRDLGRPAVELQAGKQGFDRVAVEHRKREDRADRAGVRIKGSSANEVAQEQNILVRVFTWQWTSSPMVTSRTWETGASELLGWR